MPSPIRASRASSSLSEAISLTDGWELASTPAGDLDVPPGDQELGWIPAVVPGTVAGALRQAGLQEPDDLDAHDWWYRTRFRAQTDAPTATLRLSGLATVAEVYLNGRLVLQSASMFTEHAVDARDRLAADNELVICFRALTPLLGVSRRPRARWRTRLVAQGGLRFYRTALIGRAPGFAPGPAIVGPWRGVQLATSAGPLLDRLSVTAELVQQTGTVRIAASLRRLSAGAEVRLDATVDGPSGPCHGTLVADAAPDGTCHVSGAVIVSDACPWWPHTHGEPTRYRVRLTFTVDDEVLAHKRYWIGFRTLCTGEDIEHDGVALTINGVAVFARGAVWTPLDMATPHVSRAQLRRVLDQVRAAGMNMLRVPGISYYESDDFYELCDELGILVWQDFMFANMDYPDQDEQFMSDVETEARQLLERVAWRPSLTILCGGSEVAQQASMLGIDPRLDSSPLYGELLPSLINETGTAAGYVPSTPWGGDVPFRTDTGVANYYGVGAYLRPLTDARRAEVKFAAECLAFSNVPDSPPDATVDGHEPGPNDPVWKAGVPRDVGADWDFEDVREHYLQLLFGTDPGALRTSDVERYLTLSRLTSAEVMTEVFGEWRRARSPCAGALVLWLTDLYAGAGWGLLDHRGRPKLAFDYLRRVLAPVAVWSTDEGLGGIVAHVANDRPDPLSAQLRVGLYRERELPVADATVAIELGPHESCEHNVEELLGGFVDVSWSYKFGPPAQDLVALSLERTARAGKQLLSQSFRLPIGPPTAVESAAGLGLSARARRGQDGEWSLKLLASRFVYCCRVTTPGFAPSDDGFSLEPGHGREVALRSVPGESRPPGGQVTAANLQGSVGIAVESDG